jgi:hypothetical protein
VWCLVVGVDAPLTVRFGHLSIRARTALIPPRLTHHLSMVGPLVSCSLNPAAQRTAACRAEVGEYHAGIGVGHAAEADLVIPPGDDIAAQRWLDAAAPSDISALDPRIELAAKQIRDDPLKRRRRPSWPRRSVCPNPGSAPVRQEVGSSLRRYRLWSRLMRAGAEFAPART